MENGGFLQLIRKEIMLSGAFIILVGVLILGIFTFGFFFELFPTDEQEIQEKERLMFGLAFGGGVIFLGGLLIFGARCMFKPPKLSEKEKENIEKWNKSKEKLKKELKEEVVPSFFKDARDKLDKNKEARENDQKKWEKIQTYFDDPSALGRLSEEEFRHLKIMSEADLEEINRGIEQSQTALNSADGRELNIFDAFQLDHIQTSLGELKLRRDKLNRLLKLINLPRKSSIPKQIAVLENEKDSLIKEWKGACFSISKEFEDYENLNQSEQEKIDEVNIKYESQLHQLEEKIVNLRSNV